MRTLNRFANLSIAFLLVLFISFSTVADEIPDDPGVISAGQALFNSNCKQCHNFERSGVGPNLRDSHERWELPNLIAFIRAPQRYIETANDPYAKQLYEEYRQYMPNHAFSDDEIISIIAFIKHRSEEVPEEAAGADPASVQVSAHEDTQQNLLIMILVVITLVLVLILLFVFLSVIRKFLKDKEDQLEPEDKDLVHQRFDVGKVLKSKGFIGILSVVFVVFLVRGCWMGMMAAGVDQGYAPVQPIPFSHALHAGEYGIDCNYCHTGAVKGKQAGIPSLNICMNCHGQIKSGPEFGEEAIATLVNAYEENRPIQWVRVHNLPDLAYFNHSQHVDVGGIKCQTCHGPIEEMEVVYQYSPLTMGWCINCHRETEVNGADNAYYDRLIQVHNKQNFTVAEIGGLDCARCHY
ncbi:c-type cytochrome [Cytophagaceae bacterium ABcell3]|nr:c-type cytochrome [Cytophagaceae bacterium ABcell3]